MARLDATPIGTLPEGWWQSNDWSMPDWSTLLDTPGWVRWWMDNQVAGTLLLVAIVAVAVIGGSLVLDRLFFRASEADKG